MTQWQTIQIPFVAGLRQGTDARAMEPPGLAVAKDVEFDEQGCLRTRKPYVADGILDENGATITNPRKLESRGDELLMTSKTALYTRSVAGSKWYSRGTHLAIDVEETPRFVTTDDQIDCDRAELNGIIVYAWATASPSVIYVAAVDKTTGATILPPTATSVGEARPRLVALTTKILLFVVTGDPLLAVYAIDPASPGTAIAGSATTVVNAPDFNSYYDAVKIPTLDSAAFAARRTPTTSYQVGTITAGLTINQSTKARTCDGPIAVSPTPDGASLQIIRANGTNIQGDLLVRSTLVDTFTAQAVGTAAGTPVNQIAAAHRSVLNGGQYRCYAFWSAQESTLGTTGWQCKTNYVDTGNSLGTQSVLRLRLGVASRAFDYNGEVYVWLAFAGDSYTTGVGVPLGFRAQFQNTYFLYRDDAHLASKCVWQVGGGFSFHTGYLPGVALTSGSTTYSWCGIKRRIIQLGDASGPGAKRSGYDARAPQDVTFTFDSNLARRIVKIGDTHYISGGLICQYDGAGIWEVGTQVYPWNWSSVPVAGSIPAGDYAYRATMRWDNAKGERERSTTATGEKITSAGSQQFDFQIVPLHVTRKGTAPAIEMWRTAVNPPDDAPFFLATSLDPASGGDNRYLGNLPTSAFTATWSDDMTDTTLSKLQASPENGAVLENTAPPGARVIFATDQRVFLGDVAGDPDNVWYSKLRNAGEIVAFHEILTVPVPPVGGRVTAIWFTEETLFVSRETAIYAFPGTGFDNASGGNNYGPAVTVALDVGAISQEAVAITPRGVLLKTLKGWYVQRGNQVGYVGNNVSGYDSETIVSTVVVESQHQVRCLSANRLLTWDYNVDEWAEWTITGGLDACMWRGQHMYLTSANAFEQDPLGTTFTYGMDVETGWIKLAGLQGYGVCRFLQVLGEWESAHRVRVQVARDYETSSGQPKFFDDKSWPSDGVTAGDTLQFRHAPTRVPSSAIKVRITAIGTTTTAAQRTLSAGGDWAVGGTVATSGTAWAATLVAKQVGEDWNGALMLSVYTSIGATGVEVRDNETFDGTSWSASPFNVGVRVGGTVTVKQLETAIADSSKLIGVLTADPSPSKTITDTNTLHRTNGFTGAVDTVPIGSALKLTGLALEFAPKQGINKRLVEARKQ